nr:hypothetical protein Itr_chr06CG03490 [Ipomoea trifida]
MVEGKHEELEVGEPGDEEGGGAAEMDGVEGEREEEKERDYREEKQQPGKANGSHFCSEETVEEREVYGEPYLDEDGDLSFHPMLHISFHGRLSQNLWWNRRSM